MILSVIRNRLTVAGIPSKYQKKNKRKGKGKKKVASTGTALGI
jgi:hypothetical protein